ncbi:MAG: membrane dipeptidase [Syntrophomonadaceae bacterium]|nr:membrane dipeptidase [Syntrophomonadaceae bacterium]
MFLRPAFKQVFYFKGGVITKIIDLHCDTISIITEKDISLYSNNCHLDLVRSLEANILVQFFALFTMPTDSKTAFANIMLQVEKFLSELELNQDYIYLVKKYIDIDLSSNKIGAILHLEGAEAIGTDIELLSLLYRLGLRSLGLTWNHRNLLADGIGEGIDAGGLSKLGKKVIKEMLNLGIILDLSHISEKAYFEAFDYYDKPIMVTHSNVRKLCPHPRNLSDDQLKVLAQNGGVVGINQVSFFTSQNKASIDDLIDHIKYIADFIGINHVALGSDFDGADEIIMSGIEEYKIWDELLLSHGFSPEEIDMILYKNALNVIERVLT